MWMCCCWGGINRSINIQKNWDKKRCIDFRVAMLTWYRKEVPLRCSLWHPGWVGLALTNTLLTEYCSIWEGRKEMKLALDWQIGAWHWSNAIVVDMPEEKLVHQHLRFTDSDILSYQPRISSATDSSKGDNVLWRVEDIQPLVAKVINSTPLKCS